VYPLISTLATSTFFTPLPYGYFIQSSTSIKKVFPLLWKYVEGRKWVFREELTIPVREVLVPKK